MTHYTSIRIRVELWGHLDPRPMYASAMTRLATFECDTCERTATSRHIICPECGAVWATQLVWRQAYDSIKYMWTPLGWSASLRRCPECGDGTLVGAPDVYAPHRDDEPLAPLMHRELRLPHLPAILDARA